MLPLLVLVRTGHSLLGLVVVVVVLLRQRLLLMLLGEHQWRLRLLLERRRGRR